MTDQTIPRFFRGGGPEGSWHETETEHPADDGRLGYEGLCGEQRPDDLSVEELADRLPGGERSCETCLRIADWRRADGAGVPA